jgi:hypothetical protein
MAERTREEMELAARDWARAKAFWRARAVRNPEVNG